MSVTKCSCDPFNLCRSLHCDTECARVVFYAVSPVCSDVQPSVAVWTLTVKRGKALKWLLLHAIDWL